MGANGTLASAVRKAFEAVLGAIPNEGSVLCSIADRDKTASLEVLAKLADLGFSLYATDGTAVLLEAEGIVVKKVAKIGRGRPDVVDVIEDGTVDMVINTITYGETDEMSFDGTEGRKSMVAEKSVKDGYRIRRAADERRIPCVTSLDTLRALVESVENRRRFATLEVASLQDWKEKKVEVAR
jgi:carbamoyl-phosphate synthase large subunit